MKLPDVNSRILEIVGESGLTSAQFAQKINTSGAVISHISKGRNKPNLELLIKVLRVYTNVNIEWLVLGKGAKKLKKDKPLDYEPKDKTPTTSGKISGGTPEDKNAGPDLQLLNELLVSQRNAIKSLEQVIDNQGKLINNLNLGFKKDND